MARKDAIPQKPAVGHLYSPADSKRYNIPRTFSGSPKANPYNKGSGVDLAQSVARPNLKGAKSDSASGRGLKAASSQSHRGAGADLAKVYPVTVAGVVAKHSGGGKKA